VNFSCRERGAKPIALVSYLLLTQALPAGSTTAPMPFGRYQRLTFAGLGSCGRSGRACPPVAAPLLLDAKLYPPAFTSPPIHDMCGHAFYLTVLLAGRRKDRYYHYLNRCRWQTRGMFAEGRL